VATVDSPVSFSLNCLQKWEGRELMKKTKEATTLLDRQGN
jgi:hypothetical protein